MNEYSLRTKLLCLDEFQVTDIADAMILRRVLEGLSAKDITLVTTSNRRPDGNKPLKHSNLDVLDLYLNGIQRSSFLPCIEHIKNSMKVINLSSQSDYRLSQSESNLTVPNFQELCPDAKSINLHILGRTIFVPRGEIGKACECTFDQLLGAPLSAADYMEICRNFPKIFITAIPTLNDTMRNELRRLITFIDICYERKVRPFVEIILPFRLPFTLTLLSFKICNKFNLNW